MPSDLTSVAVYRRRVGASLERVWENVRDWEHLPWLHSSSFSAIVLEEEGEWGWRARIDPQPASPDSGFRLELMIDGDRYVSRTLDGPTGGSEIWTRLTPIDASHTDIEVEFLLPNVAAGTADDIGALYTALYSALWDEDERMMTNRQAMLDARAAAPPAPSAHVELGQLERVRAELPLVVEFDGRRYRIVDIDGELVAHSLVCPHMLGPLDEADVENGCVECPWHGYRFDVRTGESSDGRRLRLPRAPLVQVAADGTVRLVGADR